MKSTAVRLLSLAAFAALSAFSLTPAHAALNAYTIDNIHSSVIFRVQHFGAGHVYGRFNTFSGSFTIDDAKPEASSVNISVDVASIDTNQKDRDKDLLSPDYLDAGAFPKITFVSTAVKAAGDKAYEVTGNLTLHGATKAVTVRMEKTGEALDKWGDYRLGLEGTLEIKRTDYGMNKHLDGVGDAVRLLIAIEGTKKK
jgi:polyisoprenoid-binding protein YceI